MWPVKSYPVKSEPILSLKWPVVCRVWHKTSTNSTQGPCVTDLHMRHCHRYNKLMTVNVSWLCCYTCRWPVIAIYWVLSVLCDDRRKEFAECMDIQRTACKRWQCLQMTWMTGEWVSEWGLLPYHVSFSSCLNSIAFIPVLIKVGTSWCF